MTLQQEIIQALGAKPHINPEEEIRRSVDFLKAYLKTYPFLKSLVLGREETGDNALQFIAVRLPYGVQADEQDCQDAIAFIQPDRVLTVNIKGAVLASEQALREAGIELSDFVRGNEKARERMKAQAVPILTRFIALTNARANSFSQRWAVLSICIKKSPPPIWKTTALHCLMKPRWA